MSDITITETAKQIVITRLAAIDSATSILSLINGRPAKVIADEVITLAARIETWAWRALLAENPAVSQDEAPAESRQPERPVLSKVEGPVTMTPPDKPVASLPKPNGHGQRQGDATENQINAILAIGKAKGYTSQEIEAWVHERRHKGTTALNKREASMLIEDLNAM